MLLLERHQQFLLRHMSPIIAFLGFHVQVFGIMGIFFQKWQGLGIVSRGKKNNASGNVPAKAAPPGSLSEGRARGKPEGILQLRQI